MRDPVRMRAGLRFFVVPHTHWDREWYAPFEYFRLRLAEVVDGVIDVLERDPGFSSFTLDGQAVVLEDYLDVRPEREPALRRLLADGRIEVGPSYVLPDEFLVCGESLVRNLLIGRAVCRRFGADPSPVGYLPDSFGHPLQLPQVLSGFGIDSFIFSRGLGDELDETGVVFRWQAPDGSQVLATQQLPDYSNLAAISGADDAERRVRAIEARFGALLAQAGVDAVALCNGSDHLPVTPELPELCAELERRFPGSRFTIARYSDFVAALGDPDVPVWSGELLGSRLQNVLRGVNSARLYVKRANDRAEQRLLAAETLAALRHLHDGTRFPAADFTLAWRDLLRCQPHDTICGCSCDEVHRDALVRYESLHRTLGVLEARALDGLVSGESGGPPEAGTQVSVVNGLPFRRRGVVEVSGARPAVVELDAFATAAVTLDPADHDPEPSSGDAIENDRFRVQAGSDGSLTLFDKRRDRRFERLHLLEDEPDMGDLYNFCPVDGEPMWRSEGARAAARVLSSVPEIAELEIRIEAERPAGLDAEFRPLAETLPLIVVTVVRLVRGSDRIEFRTTIENTVRDHRLRVVFPAGTTADTVRAEGHFALVRRPLAPAPPRTDWVEPPDATQHTLGTVALGPIALLTRGLPEYEARSGTSGASGLELCLTLLRCTGLISQPSHVISTRPHTAGPQVRTPEGQCMGRQVCEYALLPGADELGDLALLREAQDYRQGFPTVPRPSSSLLPPAVAIEGDVIFSCLKGAEDGDGVVLRCYNPSPDPATLRVAGELTVTRLRLDETAERPVAEGRIEVGGGEIATLRLRRRG